MIVLSNVTEHWEMFEVWLNGAKIPNCFLADEEKGVVYCCKGDYHGRTRFIRPSSEVRPEYDGSPPRHVVPAFGIDYDLFNSGLTLEALYGKVEVRLRGGFPLTDFERVCMEKGDTESFADSYFGRFPSGKH